MGFVSEVINIMHREVFCILAQYRCDWNSKRTALSSNAIGERRTATNTIQSTDSIAVASICLPTPHPLSCPFQGRPEKKKSELLRGEEEKHFAKTGAGQRLRQVRSDKRKWVHVMQKTILIKG